MSESKILFYGINYSPELIGTGKYTSEMCEWFANREYDVRMITALPYYPDWKIFKGFSSWRYMIERVHGVKVYRCPLYVPSRVTAFKRIFHLCSFMFSSMPVLLAQIFWRPKAIVVIVPTIMCLPVAILVAKMSGARLILHVQDFELDAMLGLGMASTKVGFLRKMAYDLESWLMRRCDKVTTITESMRLKLIEKNMPAGHTELIPNWSDLQPSQLDMQDNYYRRRWQISTEEIVVLYSGNIGLKQGLDLLLDACDHFKDRQDVVFVVVGHGAYKQTLVDQAERQQINNIKFYDLQPIEKLTELLSMADIHLVLQKKGAADNVFPSKLTNILSIGGRALITAEKGTELGKLVHSNPGIAQICEPEDKSDFINSLDIMIAQTDAQNRRVNPLAHDYASANLRKDPILSKLKNIILQ